jgi:hypothetical protein
VGAVLGDSVVWEQPPPRKDADRVGAWERRLMPLRERPGEWARVKDGLTERTAQTYASELRRTKRYRKPAGRYEFAARGGAIYARYLGDGE